MYPIPPEDYQSQGPLYCARAFSRYAGERLVFLGLAASHESGSIYECAKFCIEDSVVQRADWCYMRPSVDIDVAACEKLKIRQEDLILADTEVSALSGLCLTLVGATVVLADDDSRAYSLLKKKAEASGINLSPKRVLSLSEVAESFGLNQGSSFSEALSWVTPGRDRVGTNRQYGRVMEAVGCFDSLIFTRGSLAVLEQLSAPKVKSLSVSDGAEASAESERVEKPLLKQSMRSWLEAAVSSKLLFPAFSASYLMKGLAEKMSPQGFELNEEAFGFELSNLLKEGSITPDNVLHKKLFEELSPIIALYKEKTGVRLTEVKETADRIRSKPVDFVMLRAALMKSGHPTYQPKSPSFRKDIDAKKSKGVVPGV